MYLSSFSKTLAPGYRVAWIDAPPPVAAKFEIAKQAADLCTGELDQRIVYEACRRGILDRQAPMLRAHYQHKRDVMVAALAREFGGDAHVARSARRILPLGDAAAARRRRRDDPRARSSTASSTWRARRSSSTAAAASSSGCRSRRRRRIGSRKACGGWRQPFGRSWRRANRNRQPRQRGERRDRDRRQRRRRRARRASRSTPSASRRSTPRAARASPARGSMSSGTVASAARASAESSAPRGVASNTGTLSARSRAPRRWRRRAAVPPTADSCRSFFQRYAPFFRSCARSRLSSATK